MAFFVVAGVLIFVTLLVWAVGAILRKDIMSFESNKRIGKAEVVYGKHENGSSLYTLGVRLPELNDGKMYSCYVKRIHAADYPKGAVIDVYYAPEKVAGMDIAEVQPIDDPPTNRYKLVKAIKIFSTVMFVIAAILVVAGIITVLF